MLGWLEPQSFDDPSHARHRQPAQLWTSALCTSTLPRMNVALFMRPTVSSAGRKCFVRDQQAPHLVCLGGQLGLPKHRLLSHLERRMPSDSTPEPGASSFSAVAAVASAAAAEPEPSSSAAATTPGPASMGRGRSRGRRAHKRSGCRSDERRRGLLQDRGSGLRDYHRRAPHRHVRGDPRRQAGLLLFPSKQNLALQSTEYRKCGEHELLLSLHERDEWMPGFPFGNYERVPLPNKSV